jgi:hypothetical protein
VVLGARDLADFLTAQLVSNGWKGDIRTEFRRELI